MDIDDWLPRFLIREKNARGTIDFSENELLSINVLFVIIILCRREYLNRDGVPF